MRCQSLVTWFTSSNNLYADTFRLTVGCLYSRAKCTTQPKPHSPTQPHTTPRSPILLQTKLTNLDVSDSNAEPFIPEATRPIALFFFQPPSPPSAAALAPRNSRSWTTLKSLKHISYMHAIGITIALAFLQFYYSAAKVLGSGTVTMHLACCGTTCRRTVWSLALHSLLLIQLIIATDNKQAVLNSI